MTIVMPPGPVLYIGGTKYLSVIVICNSNNNNQGNHVPASMAFSSSLSVGRKTSSSINK